MTGRFIAIVGAESTGKTTLAAELVAALKARGLAAAMVPEALRDFCDLQGRTPRMEEQSAIAREQTRRIEQAREQHAVVLADTTALMIAVYSDLLFQDDSLYAPALQAHGLADLTLLTALDLPWVADGHQRDGAHVREPVDTLIRHALHRAGLPYSVVAGRGGERVTRALQSVDHLLDAPQRSLRARSIPRWKWVCDHCGDGECEQHWLPRSS